MYKLKSTGALPGQHFLGHVRVCKSARKKCAVVCKHSANPFISLDVDSGGHGHGHSHARVEESSDSAPAEVKLPASGRSSTNGGAPQQGHGHAHGDVEHGHGGSDHGHGGAHVHHELDSSWGPLRTAIYALLQRTNVLKVAHFLSHSFRSALLSSVCFLAYASLHTGFGAGGTAAAVGSSQALAGRALLASSLFLSGLPAMTDALVQVMHLRIDAHVLMALAGCSSFLLGLPLEGALLFVLFHMAHALEAKFVRAAHASLRGLLDAVPATAMVVGQLASGGVDWKTQAPAAVANVAVGSLVAVKPGEAVPLDGTVVEGKALVGQENVTGESLPVLKSPGAAVFSGGQVLDGVLVVRTTAAAADSTAARIAGVTAAALQQRAPVEAKLTLLTRRWSEAVIAGTAAAFTALLLAGVPAWGQSGALYRALGLLTAAAPCALLLIPLAFVCAIAVLSRNGIVVKGAHLFDALLAVRYVALDKTGTLSRGRLSCSAVQPIYRSEAAALDALEAAAALSMRGRHPVCSAVLSYFSGSESDQAGAPLAQRPAASAPPVENFSSQPGAGMSGTVDGAAVRFGSVDYVASLLSASLARKLRTEVQRAGSNAVHSVLVEFTGDADSGNGSGRPAPVVHSATLFVFIDKPKADSKAAIAKLRSMGLAVGVYTGDNQGSAAAMAAQIGVAPDEVHAGLTPEEKAALVGERQDAGQIVLMVGDGLNDAPALAKADVGVALAEGMESATAGVADVVLLQHALEGEVTMSAKGASIQRIAMLLETASAVRSIVLQNLTIAFGSMLIGGLPALGGWAPLWLAVLLHEGSTVLVALNSCRLLLLKPPKLA